MLAGALADELMLATMSNDRLVPSEEELDRIEAETREAVEVLRRHGWLDDPAGFHVAPAAPAEVTLQRRRFGRVRYDELTFDSGFQPVADLPGADRWRAMEANRVARSREFSFVLYSHGRIRALMDGVVRAAREGSAAGVVAAS